MQNEQQSKKNADWDMIAQQILKGKIYFIVDSVIILKTYKSLTISITESKIVIFDDHVVSVNERPAPPPCMFDEMYESATAKGVKVDKKIKKLQNKLITSYMFK